MALVTIKCSAGDFIVDQSMIDTDSVPEKWRPFEIVAAEAAPVSPVAAEAAPDPAIAAEATATDEPEVGDGDEEESTPDWL